MEFWGDSGVGVPVSAMPAAKRENAAWPSPAKPVLYQNPLRLFQYKSRDLGRSLNLPQNLEKSD